MNQTLVQTRPIVIGGIYKYTKPFGETGELVVEGMSNDFVRAWVLDENRQNTSVHVSYSPELIGKQIGYDITYSPAYQALQDHIEHLQATLKAKKILKAYVTDNHLPAENTLDLIHLHISASILEAEMALDKLKNPKPDYTLDPIHTGLSPLWDADRCVIPVPNKPKTKWQGFTGRKINVLYFAQGCTITSVFNRYGYEWAKLSHPIYGGPLYRKTSDLLVKDIQS